MAELESRFSVEAVAEAEKRRLAKEAGEYDKQSEKTIGNGMEMAFISFMSQGATSMGIS